VKECSPTCGDGVVDPWEECDDGNLNPGDGCGACCWHEGAHSTVSGVAGRLQVTSPAADGAVGTLCVSVRSDCTDASTEVRNTSVADADMSSPIDAPPGLESPPVPYRVFIVLSGTWQVFSHLDRDQSGCAGPPTPGDLITSAGCVEITVVSAVDVACVDFGFDTIVQ
ncbi:DUF4215 domain-containing protein, partial [Myxococcota bacterium]